MENLIMGFPKAWRGLFGAMATTQHQVLSADHWFEQQNDSKYGSSLNWQELIVSLLEREPVEDHGKLVFKPRLLCFPVRYQRSILTFIHLHKDDVPMEHMKQFLCSLQQFNPQDGWIQALMRMLSQKAYNTSPEETESMGSNLEKCSSERKSEPCYKFSAQSEALATSLIEKLKMLNLEKNNNPWMNLISGDHTAGKGGFVEDENDVTGEVVLSGSQPIPMDFETPQKVAITSNSEAPASPSSKRRRFSAIDSVEGDMEIQKRKIHEITTEEMQKNQEYNSQAEKLREVWSSGGDAAEIQPELEMFKTCTAEEIKKVCDLNFKLLDEVAFITACHHISSLGTEISYINCVSFAGSVLLPKIQELEQNASRHFIAAVISFAKTFPKQVIDAIFIPVLMDGAGKCQADLATKVMREAFSPEHKQMLLRQMIKSGVHCSEDVCAIIQAILESLSSIDDDLLRDLVSFLDQFAASLANSLKYGKLLLALLNKHGKQIIPDDRVMISHILKVHKTFMRKSAESVLHRLG